MATGTITDDELRNQLVDLGENVGPVTPSTRPLLLRKLKRLQKEGTNSAKGSKKDTRRKSTPSNAKRRQSPSRKLIGFSSDEEGAETSSRTRRSVASSRVGRKKEEDEISRDETDASREDQDRSRDDRGNSSVHGFSQSEASNIRDEFSDSDSTAYTGPFQRGSFRFRSFRRKKNSPESARLRQSKEELSFYSNQTPVDNNIGQDNTDGFYRLSSKRTPFSSLLNAVAFVVVFICVLLLAAYYLDVFPPDRYEITSTHSECLPFCREGFKSQDCLDKEQVRNAYVVYLINLLARHAGQYDCGYDSVNNRYIPKDDLVHKLKEKITSDFPTCGQSKLKNITDIVMDFLTTNISHEYSITLLNNKSEVIDTDVSGDVHWLESVKSIKSLVCRIQQSFSRVMTGMVAIACVAVLVIAIYFGVRNHWQKEEEDTRKMYKFVENIIDILRKHHDACKSDKDLPPYLPIPHVRDMLIKPEERKTKAGIWHRAVRFLSANESRIRVESQRIAGEDFEVWRWIHITSPKHHSHNKVALQGSTRPKCWQGQAFENFQWAVNPPIISPTPCLKIRNMFDPDMEVDDRWHVIIQDAILEKCIDAGASIVHIAVDKSSSEGCVYVKCDSHTSAGVAFKCLHGSWFDGCLVAVKYLTLRRYHQRFPKALTATGSLTPSGTSPSSLVTLDPEDDMDANDSETEV